jgi:hypothetical protein
MLAASSKQSEETHAGDERRPPVPIALPKGEPFRPRQTGQQSQGSEDCR